MPLHRAFAAWVVTGPPGRAVAMVIDLSALAAEVRRTRRGKARR
ncbi:MAG: hypothetical protein WCL20_02855 [Actinomycetes bacterium]